METIFLWLVLLLPLLSAAMALAISERHVGWVSSVLIGAMAVAALGLVATGPATLRMNVSWWELSSLSVGFQLLASPFVKIMIAAVAAVSLAVHVFSLTYIAQSRKRYFATVGLFTFSMTGLLVSDHLIVLFCFWELMGICSYLLIGFWRSKASAAAAATKAFLINKVGDGALLAAILLLFVQYDTFALTELIARATQPADSIPIGFLFFVAIAAKSAQWPLHGWLPDAMEGPTPVSALIHAATMVAAGVILYARVVSFVPAEVHFGICLLALATACLGGYQALVAFDIKKILAYSTLSQLGLMIAAVAAGAADAGLMHLLAHAFFKAGLFLAAALVIHHYHQQNPQGDSQDLRFMGGLRTSTPALFVVVLLLAAALAGVPLTSGFLSKENILAALFAYAVQVGGLGVLLLALFFLASLFTVLYVWRLVSGIFLGPGDSHKSGFANAQWFATGALALGSGSYLISLWPWASQGWLASWLGATLAPVPTWVALSSIIWLALAATLARVALTNKRYRWVKPLPYSIDRFYAYAFTRPIQALAWGTSHFDSRVLDGALHVFVLTKVSAAHVVSWLDQHLVDGVANGCARALALVGNLIRKPTRGEVQQYLLWAAAGMIIFLFWVLN
jgi:NADH-quinone oxidoreductase subunit L